MGRITINGTQAGFSCKKEVSLALWDVKTNRAKGKSEEARTCLLYTSGDKILFPEDAVIVVGQPGTDFFELPVYLCRLGRLAFCLTILP